MGEGLGIILFLHFLNDGIRTAIVSILPFVAKDLHFNYAVIGILGASHGLFATFLAYPAGFLSSKFGGFKMIILSLLIYSLAQIGISIASHAAIFILFFYITASGFGMFHTIGYTLVARVSGKINVGKNLGNFTAIGDIGRIAVPALAIMLASSIFQWRFTYLTLAIVGVTSYLILRLNKNPKPLLKNTNLEIESPKEWIKHTFYLLRQRKLALIMSSNFIDSLAGNSMYIFLPFLLLAKGIKPVELGLFIPTYFLGSFAGKFILGRGSDKFGASNMFVLAEVLMAINIIFLVSTNYFFLILAISFLLGLFTRGTTPVLATLIFSITHDKHYEKVAATSEFITGFAAVIAPAILGLLADRFGINFVFYSCAILAILAITPIVILGRQRTIEGV